MSLPKSPGFYWDPNFRATLTESQCHFVVAHERSHLLFARLSGQLTEEQYDKAEADIAAFERGDDPGPRAYEGTVGFVFPKATDRWDSAVDTAVLKVIEDRVNYPRNIP